MIRLHQHAQGVIVPVRAQPGAKRDAVTGEHDGQLKIAVSQAPEKGKANKAIIEVLAEALQVKKSQCELLSGETSREKTFLIRDVPLSNLAERLTAMLKSLNDGKAN